MPEIIHSTKTTPQGPWLISREQLLELDKLVEAEWAKLVEHHDLLIEKEVEEELVEWWKRLTKDLRESSDKKNRRKELKERLTDRHAYKKRRSLIIHLSGDRRVASDSFEEALRDPALINEKPVGFTITLDAAGIECGLEVPCYRRSLQLKVAPDRDPVAKGLFAALNTWVDQAKPPSWQMVWLGFQSVRLTWTLWICSLFSVFCLLMLFAPDSSAGARSARHSEAVALLKSGVSETNQFKALELILSYESRIVPVDRTISVPSWFWWLICGGAMFCIALEFVPNVVLGIGRGSDSIKNWEKWMRTIGIAFPTWILGTFIFPKVQQWLANLF